MQLTTPLLLFNNTLECKDFVIELNFNKIMKVIFVDEKWYKDIMRKQRTMKANDCYMSILELDFYKLKTIIFKINDNNNIYL